MDPGSVSYGPEPGFLYSDGMSGGTGIIFVPPWDVYRKKRRRASRTPRQDPPQRSPEVLLVPSSSDPAAPPLGLFLGPDVVVISQ